MFGGAKYQGGDKAETRVTDEQTIVWYAAVDTIWRNLPCLAVVI